MKRMMKLATVAVGLVALLATGCGGGGGGDNTPSGNNPITIPPCTSNTDCKTGQTCNADSGNCVTPTTTDCTNDASICTSEQECVNGFCSTVEPDCTADADCGEGNQCTGGKCYAKDAPPTNDVVSSGCTSSADCADGMNCVDGACMVPGPSTDTGAPPQDTTLPPPMDTGAPPTPAGSCSSIMTCVNQCNPNDIQACMAACLGAAPPEAQQQFNTMVQCQQGCPGAEPNTVDIACMTETCFPEAHACLGTPGQELDCNGVFTCLNACPQSDQNCPGACLLSAKDKASFDAFFAIIDCISTACPDSTDPNDTTCQNEALGQGGACFDTLTACVGALPGGKPGIFMYQRFFQWLMDWHLLAQPIH